PGWSQPPADGRCDGGVGEPVRCPGSRSDPDRFTPRTSARRSAAQIMARRSISKKLAIAAAVVVPAAAVLVVANLPAQAAVNPGPGFPTRYAAPYIDTSIAPSTLMADVKLGTGQKYFTLAFVIDAKAGGCQAKWNGDTSVTGGYWSSEVNSLRAAGGDVIVSFGGAAGTELGVHCSTVSALQTQYQTVIDAYNLTR